jgi:predicted transcriptional regulator
MLTAFQLDKLPAPMVELWDEYTTSVINDIARRLSKLDMTATAAWQMQRLSESGMVYEDILEQLSRMTGKSEATLRELFKQAGIKAMRFDDSIYRKAGLEPMPLNLSPSMAETLAAGLSKTNGVMRNLTLTTAMTGQEAFVQAADLAYMQVSTGAMSYDQAIKAAVKQVAQEGLSVINYASGRTDQLDVAMRRTVLTGVAQTTGRLTTARMDEMGVDLVQTSAHAGSRPTHEPWQGKIFSRSGTSTKYPDFVSSTGYGAVDGLMGINCRHTFFPFFEGISENAYKQAELDSDYNNQTVNYQGKEIDQYKASQIQRSLERRVRLYKREASALDAAGIDNSQELAKVKDYQAELRNFVKQTNLRRQYVREQI